LDLYKGQIVYLFDKQGDVGLEGRICQATGYRKDRKEDEYLWKYVDETHIETGSTSRAGRNEKNQGWKGEKV